MEENQHLGEDVCGIKLCDDLPERARSDFVQRFPTALQLCNDILVFPPWT